MPLVDAGRPLVEGDGALFNGDAGLVQGLSRLPAGRGVDDLVVGAVAVGTAHGISSYKKEVQ